MTDTTQSADQDRSLPHLSPAESRLGALFGRPRTAAWVCIVVLTALGWAYLALAAAGPSLRGPSLLDVLCGPVARAGSASDIALLVAMWSAMVFAMMLPTAGPMIFTYAEIADTAARKGEPIVSPFWLVAGYAAVWLGFAVLAAAAQAVLIRFAVLDNVPAGRLLTAALFALAGAYQFSRLKQACLSVCQRPFPFFFANWTTTSPGVVRLGLRQGLHCLGCCWAMMLLMLATGAMNVVWMAALGVLMTAEKMTATRRLSRAAGFGFLGVAAAFAASYGLGL